MSFHRVHGIWLTVIALLSPRGWKSTAAVLRQLKSECRWSHQDHELYMLLGYAKVGKSTLATHHPFLRECVHVSGDHIMSVVDQEFAWLCQQKGFYGPMYMVRRVLSMLLIMRLLAWLKPKRASVVLDLCNHHLPTRRIYLWIAKRAGYRRTIIHLTCDRSVHQRRLVEADRHMQAQGRSSHFLENYLRMQVKAFVPPRSSEAEEYIVVSTDQTSPGATRIPLRGSQLESEAAS